MTAALLLVGCGDPQAGTVSDQYLCHDEPVPLETLPHGRPAADRGTHGAAALQGRRVPSVDTDAGWRIIEESEERFAIVRKLATPQRDARPLDQEDTHELILMERQDWDESGEPYWKLSSHRSCDLQRDLWPLNPVHVRLDRDHPAPDAGATRVHLEALDLGCAGRVPSQERIELLEFQETDTQVRVVAGIEPPPDRAHECTGNIPADLVLELDAPLGDRQLIDDSVHPPRTLAGGD